MSDLFERAMLWLMVTMLLASLGGLACVVSAAILSDKYTLAKQAWSCSRQPTHNVGRFIGKVWVVMPETVCVQYSAN